VDSFVIPPVLLYAFGTVLTVLGGLRAYFLGWKQRPDVPEEEERGNEGVALAPEGAADDQDDGAELRGEMRGKARGDWSDGKRSSRHKRHIGMGLLWLGMGLFLIISTATGNR
jgi:hypothetical protein